jgi:hypothetical protein
MSDDCEHVCTALLGLSQPYEREASSYLALWEEWAGSLAGRSTS